MQLLNEDYLQIESNPVAGSLTSLPRDNYDFHHFQLARVQLVSFWSPFRNGKTDMLLLLLGTMAGGGGGQGKPPSFPKQPVRTTGSYILFALMISGHNLEGCDTIQSLGRSRVATA